MDIFQLIEIAKAKKASDVHLSVNVPPSVRIDGALARVEKVEPLTADQVMTAFMQLTDLNGLERYQKTFELDFKYVLPDGTFLRCNIAQERGRPSLSIRILPAAVPSIDELQLPNVYKDLAKLERGLIMISGPTGSGKTTSQAALVEYINNNQTRHVLTFEDPIEYSHVSNKSDITQRELGGDTMSFAEALKHALRHDPDVIVVGEMRDAETAAAVISLAETGHLVISTGHAPYAAQTVERIIDLFPHSERFLIQMRLASLLTAVLCQTLVPRADGSGRIAAVEIMLVNSAIRNLIREGKLTLLSNAIRDYGQSGNVTLDQALIEYYDQGVITLDTVRKYCHEPEDIPGLVTNVLIRSKQTAGKKK